MLRFRIHHVTGEVLLWCRISEPLMVQYRSANKFPSLLWEADQDMGYLCVLVVDISNLHIPEIIIT